MASRENRNAPENLLWTCMFFKIYSTENMPSPFANVDEKHIVSVWVVIDDLETLSKLLHIRFGGMPGGPAEQSGLATSV